MAELLLLTNYFPYGTGEEYLEPELPHLAAAFDRVIVVPTMQTRGQTPTRAHARTRPVQSASWPPRGSSSLGCWKHRSGLPAGPKSPLSMR